MTLQIDSGDEVHQEKEFVKFLNRNEREKIFNSRKTESISQTFQKLTRRISSVFEVRKDIETEGKSNFKFKIEEKESKHMKIRPKSMNNENTTKANMSSMVNTEDQISGMFDSS